MGIGPSTKETSLHHFRDPLLDVVSSDEDLDLMGIIIVGTPDDNTDKLACWNPCGSMGGSYAGRRSYPVVRWMGKQ